MTETATPTRTDEVRADGGIPSTPEESELLKACRDLDPCEQRGVIRGMKSMRPVVEDDEPDECEATGRTETDEEDDAGAAPEVDDPDAGLRRARTMANIEALLRHIVRGQVRVTSAGDLRAKAFVARKN